MNILITGGSGLIGQRLTRLLRSKGFQVSWLVRNPSKSSIPTYRWSPQEGFIDPAALENAQVLIHLAGENVGTKKWTPQRKRAILESRTKSTELLADALKTQPNKINTVICASATGFYGQGSINKIYSEEDQQGDDFLAEVTSLWERSAQKFQINDIRLVSFRIGIVLSREGGALAKLAIPIRFFAGAPLGSGKQWMSWIHIDDLCEMFLYAIDHSQLQGVYNAVSPDTVNNANMTRAIAKQIHRPLLLPPVPEFVLKMILGEMAVIVTGGAHVSAEKILKSGFRFTYPKLDLALKNLLG